MSGPSLSPRSTAAEGNEALAIRRYRPADHDSVWAVHNLALHQVGAHVGNGPWDDDLHHLGEVYLAAGGEFFVGECDAQVVAMGALRRLAAERAEVARMRVHPDYQRRGFGQAILSRLEARAAELGYTVLSLGTTVQQTAAQRLYEKNGYAETGRTRMLGFDVIRYEKRLAGSSGGGSV
jgi:ribosomal protein S18 acetylase RimI-like enzyme